MRSCLLHILFLGFLEISFAQQMPLLSEYLHSPSLINPAMTGWEDITTVSAAYRHQWTGMPGNPITFMLNFRHFDAPRNMAYGGGILHDQTGPTSFTGINLQYAYHLKFGSEKKGEEKRNRLSIGLSLSGNQYRLDGSKLLYNDSNDPLIIANTESRFLPDAGFGLFYYADWFHIGFSIPQIISMNVQFESNNALSSIQRIAHFYLNAGVKIELVNRKKKLSKKSLKEKVKHMLIPTLWFRYAPVSPLNFYANVRYVWNQMLGFGVGGSTDGTLGFDISVHINKRFRVGYAFSLPLTDMSMHLGTNHELMISYIFGSEGNGWMFESCEKQIFKGKKKAKKTK